MGKIILVQTITPRSLGWVSWVYLQSEEIKRDPEMDKLAVWAGSGCMTVFPISRSRLISPPGN